MTGRPSGPLFPWETPFFERLKETRIPVTAKELGGLPSRVETPGPGGGGLPPTKRPRLCSARVDVSVDWERVLRAWLRVLRACPGSVAGRQLVSEGDPEVALATVRDIMAVKSSATLKRRLGAMCALEQWNHGLQLPLDEKVLYDYVSHLEASGAAPTKAQSVVEAANFTHAMLDIQFK
eukprot:6467894-Amphidinium_carterae.1